MIIRILSVCSFIINHPLNKKSKIHSIIKFFYWQIVSRLKKKRLVVNWVNESKFIMSKGEDGITGNFYCGLIEYEEMCFLLHYLRESDEFYDIGANVGAYTILASAVRKCKSYAFEPLPTTFAKLVEQLKINQIKHLVQTYNKGVALKSGELEFSSLLNCKNRVNVDPKNKNITKVLVTTLDKEFKPRAASLVKIDVEGYESFVLRGGKNFFFNKNIGALIIELNGSGKQFGIDDQDINKIIRTYGFKAVKYDPFTREIKMLSSFNKKGNTIFVKDIKKTFERCKNSQIFLVHTANKLQI